VVEGISLTDNLWSLLRPDGGSSTDQILMLALCRTGLNLMARTKFHEAFTCIEECPSPKILLFYSFGFSHALDICRYYSYEINLIGVIWLKNYILGYMVDLILKNLKKYLKF